MTSNDARKSLNEILGNHRRQAQRGRVELGLDLSVYSQGRTIWIADAHRDNGKRYVVRANEKPTTFVELESAIRACSELA